MADKQEEPHDVLAAEEFAVGAEDQKLHDGREDAPHDVLAADEFEVPAPDPALHHEHLESLPPDLVGQEPQEILAAEEFAMPSPDEAHIQVHYHDPHAHPHFDDHAKNGPTDEHGDDCDHDHLEIDLRVVAGAVAALLALVLLGRRRRRGRKARRAASQ